MAGAAPLCLTMGEPAGIGGEIALKAWLARTEASPAFFLIDRPERLRRLALSIGLDAPVTAIDSPWQAREIFPKALPVLPLKQRVKSVAGHPDPANAPAVIESITRAHALVMAGMAGAMVTNPIQKSVLYAAGFAYPGHTEFLAALAGNAALPVMMLAIEGLRVVPVTIHQSLRGALDSLTTEAIVTKARITAAALVWDRGAQAGGRRPQSPCRRGWNAGTGGDRDHRAGDRPAARRGLEGRGAEIARCDVPSFRPRRL